MKAKEIAKVRKIAKAKSRVNQTETTVRQFDGMLEQGITVVTSKGRQGFQSVRKLRAAAADTMVTAQVHYANTRFGAPC